MLQGEVRQLNSPTRRVYLRGGPKAGTFYTVGNVKGTRLYYQTGKGPTTKTAVYAQTTETVRRDGLEYEIFEFDVTPAPPGT
jgi:hypothetical protein